MCGTGCWSWPSREVGALRPRPGGALPEERAVTWNRFVGVPEARPVRGRLGVGARAALARLLDPRQPRTACVLRPWKQGGEVIQMPGGTLSVGSSSEPHFLPRLCAEVGPARPISLCVSGHRGRLPVVGWSRCLPTRKIVSTVSEITGFSPGWSGSWEGRKGRPSGERVVAARPALPGRGVGGRLQFFLSAAAVSAGLQLPWGYRRERDSPLEHCQLRWRWADCPHERSASCRTEREFPPTPPC